MNKELSIVQTMNDDLTLRCILVLGLSGLPIRDQVLADALRDYAARLEAGEADDEDYN